MKNKNLLSAFLIITPITFAVAFLLQHFSKWIMNNNINVEVVIVIILFGLTCAFLYLFKEKIKSFTLLEFRLANTQVISVGK
jgi:hypothetical protein